MINKKYTYYDLYGKPTPPPKVVPDINSLPIPPPCETWVSTMPSIGSFVPIKCNKGTCEVDRTKTINSKKYVILKEGGQCALKDLCKTDRKDVLITTGRQFVFDTLEDCNLHKEGKLTVAELRRQRDDLLKQLSTLQGKTTVPTLPNVNTVTELQAQIKQLLTEIAAIQASRRTTTTTNRLKYLCDSVKKTCTLVGSSAHSWTRLYNTKEECEDACKGTTTTTQPEAATDQ